MLEQRRRECGLGDDGVKRIASPSIPPAHAIAEREVRISASRIDYEERDKARRLSECMGRVLRSAGERYRACRLSTFVATSTYQRRVVGELTQYASEITERIKNNEGLILFGPVGTGKDHLAFGMCVELARKGYSVDWINGQSWFGLLRDAMDSKSQREASIVGDVTSPDVVVISDPLPPAGDLTQYQSSMLYRAIDSRYSQGKITITTVNIADDKEADRRMGPATWDRLCHSAWKVHCNWPSFRKPAKIIKQ